MNRTFRPSNVLAMAVLLWMAGCRDPQREYLKAKQADTAAAYQEFMLAHPGDANAILAKTRIEELLWKECLARNTLDSYRGYLAKYAGGLFKKDAETRIEEIRWQEVVHDGTLKSQRDFLGEYPASRHLAEANQLIEKLEWETVDKQSAAALKSYMSARPLGPHYREAVTSLEATLPQPPAVQPTRITVEYAIESLPAIVAKEMGYFASRGVSVKIEKTGDGDSFDLSGARWDIVTGQLIKKLPDNPNIFQYLKLFQAQYVTKEGTMVTGLLVRDDLNIKVAEDLKGKMMCVYTVLPGMEAYFEKHGLKLGGKEPNSVVILLDTSGDGMANGAATCSWGDDLDAIRKSHPGKFTVLEKNLEATYICDPYYWQISFVRRGYYESNRKEVDSAIAAMDDAIDFIRVNPDRAKQCLKPYFGYTDDQVAALVIRQSYLKSNEAVNLENLKKSSWSKVNHLADCYLGSVK